LGRVDTEIGRAAGVGKDTVRRVETIKEKAPLQLLDKIRKGYCSINKAYNEIIKEQKRYEIIRIAASTAIASKANSNARFKLINNDFRLVVKEIKDNSIDLIFTDPPYAEEYLSIYLDLAKFANRVLVEGGSIVTYLRQYDIPTIFDYMKNAGLTYHWPITVILAGPFPRAFDRGVVIKHKQLGWFTKGKRESLGYGYVDDVRVQPAE
jgi:tRNA G10  N-methylase Trm11